MNLDQKARDAQIRAIAVYEKRPDHALATHNGAAEIGQGLTCTFKQGDHSVVIDMPDAIGGYNRGPSPGFFGRAAIAGCLAAGIKMAATREGVRFDAVRVNIDMDFDNRGVLAMPNSSPVPLATRVLIEITSDESQERINDLGTRAIEHDPWYLAFKDAQHIVVATLIAAQTS